METKKIKRELRKYAATCKKITPPDRESGIRRLLQGNESAAGDISRIKGSLWTFVLEQIGWMERYCLFWQVAWIILFRYMLGDGAAFIGGGSEKEILTMISILPPLLVLLTVEEIAKVYQRSMLEIEYATKYSLRTAVMIRMAVLCVAHLLILSICVLCRQSLPDSDTGRILVYGLTPMVLMTGVILKLMQYFQGDRLRNAAVGVWLLMAVLLIIGNARYFERCQPVYFKGWCMACVIGIAFDIRQFICLNQKLKEYEQIV